MITLLSIDLRALISISHAAIYHKILFLVMHFHHLDTVMHFSTVCGTPNIYFTSSHPKHACLPLLLKEINSLLRIKPMLSQQIFLLLQFSNPHLILWLTGVTDIYHCGKQDQAPP